MIRLAAILGFATLVAAQPRVQNAQLETRVVSGSLDATIRTITGAQTGPGWIGYAVPQVAGERNMCCWNSGTQYQGCTLEPRTGDVTFKEGPGTVRLEGGSESYVLYRIEGGQIGKIRTFSQDCAIDGGGLPLYWLTGVDQAQSIAWLRALIPGTDDRAGRRMADSAVSAIALHRDGLSTLIEMAHKNSNVEARKQAVFWIGQSKDARASRFFEDVLATR